MDSSSPTLLVMVAILSHSLLAVTDNRSQLPRLKTYDTINLHVPSHKAHNQHKLKKCFDVSIFGENLSVVCKPHTSVFTEDVSLALTTAEGTLQIDPKPYMSGAIKGHVNGHDNSHVHGHLRDGLFEGTIALEKVTYFLERADKFFDADKMASFNTVAYRLRDMRLCDEDDERHGKCSIDGHGVIHGIRDKQKVEAFNRPWRRTYQRQGRRFRGRPWQRRRPFDNQQQGRPFDDQPRGRSFDEQPQGRSFDDQPRGRSFGGQPQGTSYGGIPWERPFDDKPVERSFDNKPWGRTFDDQQHERSSGDESPWPSNGHEGKSCNIKILVDHEYFHNVFDGDVQKTIANIHLVVTEVDQIFRNTDFNNDGNADNIGIRLAAIEIAHTPEGLGFSSATYPFHGFYTPEEAFRFFSDVEKMDFSSFCVGGAFTFRNFGPTLGLATIPLMSDNIVGGICYKIREVYGSTNTFFVTALDRQTKLPVPRALEVIIVAHEIGHSFGSTHDDVNPGIKCMPDDPLKRYLMTAWAPTEITNYTRQFSDCSRKLINRMLKIRGYCLR